MKKTLLVMLPVFIGLASIVGCGKREDDRNAEPQTVKTVKVAIIMPQTGPQSAIGRGAVNSIRLAFKLGEAKLAAQGLKAELEVLDDASKAETAVAQAQKVTSDAGVVLALAHFNSPCALATVGTFHEAGMPVIIPAAVNAKITEKGYREVVRTCNTDVGQAFYMARYLLDVAKVRKIYAIDDSSAFGKGLVGALDKQLATRSVKLGGADSFHVGDVDFSSLLARIEEQAPDVVVLGCMAAEGALFRKQMIEKRITVPLIGFSGIFYDTFINNAGTAADGVAAIFPLPPLEDTSGSREFLDAYKAAGYTEPYESAGPFGYVAGQVAIQVLAGGTTTRQAIIQKLRSEVFETAFGPLRFDERGEMSLNMFSFFVVKNGKWTVTHRVDSTGNIIAVAP